MVCQRHHRCLHAEIEMCRSRKPRSQSVPPQNERLFALLEHVGHGRRRSPIAYQPPYREAQAAQDAGQSCREWILASQSHHGQWIRARQLHVGWAPVTSGSGRRDMSRKASRTSLAATSRPVSVRESTAPFVECEKSADPLMRTRPSLISQPIPYSRKYWFIRSSNCRDRSFSRN